MPLPQTTILRARLLLNGCRTELHGFQKSSLMSEHNTTLKLATPLPTKKENKHKMWLISIESRLITKVTSTTCMSNTEDKSYVTLLMLTKSPYHSHITSLTSILREMSLIEKSIIPIQQKVKHVPTTGKKDLMRFMRMQMKLPLLHSPHFQNTINSEWNN